MLKNNEEVETSVLTHGDLVSRYSLVLKMDDWGTSEDPPRIC